MKEEIEVESLSDIWDTVKDYYSRFGIKGELEIEYYGYDDRIDWDTHIVTIKGHGVLGFTNGPVPDDGKVQA